MKLLEATLASTPIARPIPTSEHPQGLCLDRGYDYQAVRELVTSQRFEPHIRSRGEELAAKLRDPDWRPRRWVVEAAHSWLNRNRGILIRWSKERPEPPRPAPARQRPHRVQESPHRAPRHRPTGIGPKRPSREASGLDDDG